MKAHFPSPLYLFPFFLFSILLIFLVTQAWIWLPFVSSFFPHPICFWEAESSCASWQCLSFRFLALNPDCWPVSPALCPCWKVVLKGSVTAP